MSGDELWIDGERYRLTAFWEAAALPPRSASWLLRDLELDPFALSVVRRVMWRSDSCANRELLEDLIRDLALGGLYLVPVAWARARSAPAPAPEAQAPSRDEDGETVARSWIEIELVGEDDLSIANQRFELRLPDRSIRRGTTNHLGLARVAGIDPGSCELTFPDLDHTAWERL